MYKIIREGQEICFDIIPLPKEKEKILSEANKAKEELRMVVEKLEENGYSRKAASGMNLIIAIEKWQNRN